ncbi:cytochrome b [Stappia sp. F7233]|uniref:Cytochrome b n=1 Tax=Stappia albiluteola TaxID=2758565 RepID=A0A839AG23_9HYPH|nr:cytochrome b [Stappia albiluteola]MBA5777874.1 cytochrome b [Stappia albiluteola]
MPASAPSSYSPMQILLHWLIAALVLFQIVFGEEMEHMARDIRRGLAPDGDDVLLGNAHIWVGFAILALVAWRILLRLKNGAPTFPAGQPALAEKAMKVAHALFYALLVIAPVSGIVAWYVFPEAGEIHEFMKPAFIVLIAIHVAAALWHHFVLKDDVLKRMTRPAA